MPPCTKKVREGPGGKQRVACVGECPDIYRVRPEHSLERERVTPKCRLVTKVRFHGGELQGESVEPECVCFIDMCPKTPAKDHAGDTVDIRCGDCNSHYYKRDTNEPNPGERALTACILVMDHEDEGAINCICVLL